MNSVGLLRLVFALYAISACANGCRRLEEPDTVGEVTLIIDVCLGLYLFIFGLNIFIRLEILRFRGWPMVWPCN